ncbi:serine acetyltransferase [Rhodococcoides corynebacterioides]|uniref:serine acetyltransferase n=1 Tax=Rhodococcoides corynebacterioides TaxID=53972 RepID=UPI0009EDC895
MTATNVDYWPTRKSVFPFIRRDIRANRRNPRIQIALFLFRVTQFLMADRDSPKKRAYPMIVAYRIYTEVLLSIELRPKTVCGPGLSIHHGFGLVVNDGCVIGADVVLRQSTTLGHAYPGGPCPVLEDGAELGANVVVIGGLTIGAGSTVGAGSVVTKSVPPAHIAYGNPAAVKPRKS